MPRKKETPKRKLEEAIPEAKKKVRVRHSGGVLSLEAKGSLAGFWKQVSGELKAPVVSASFRDATGRPVSLLSDGEYPAGGALIVGPETPIESLLEDGETLNVSTKQVCVDKKKTTKKTVPGVEGLGESVETMAGKFIAAHMAPDSLLGTASAMYVTQAGAARVESASKNLARVLGSTSKTIHVEFKTSNKGKVREERVRLLSPEECEDLATAILWRQAGSNRRRATTDKPSTRLLHIDSIASKSPAFFWSLLHHSRPDADSPPDVPYMVQHLTERALANFKKKQQQEEEQDDKIV